MTTGDSVATEGVAGGPGAPGVFIEREFDAPREAVWRAFTEPAHFARWYGPQGFTVSTCEIDLRVGGRHLWAMHSPDGRSYATTGVYLEVVPPERFVVTDAPADEHGNPVSAAAFGMPEGVTLATTVTVTFEDLGGARTRVTLQQLGWPDAGMAAGAAGGWNQAFDKLSMVLASGLA